MEKTEKKRIARNKIYLESLVILFVAITPFLYKFYEYLPVDEDGSISLFWFQIGNNGFQDASVYLWFLISKIIPLLLLVIWFLSSKDWWYHIIIIPIAMYTFQLFEVVFDADNYIDTENIFWLLPICMVVIPLVYFFRLKLYDKYVNGIDLEAMEAELNSLKEKNKTIQNHQPVSENKIAATSTKNESLGDAINRKLSTANIENSLRQLQHRLQNWLHLKF